ncbi:hypothetical protein CCACVL1_27164 [Corchorus capsularis]|uniref:Uncharacterized protein n=1 Tax=Corchorus capsularis TaxID=210143 RepID=A0A1R3GBZ7_COCAP|nr:hypothetical protein CCACVL1_27164 [Corchorus capsularis]
MAAIRGIRPLKIVLVFPHSKLMNPKPLLIYTVSFSVSAVSYSLGLRTINCANTKLNFSAIIDEFDLQLGR